MYLPNFYHPISEATFNLAMLGGVLLFFTVKSLIYDMAKRHLGIDYRSYPRR